MLQLVYEIYHIFAHGTPIDPVDEFAPFVARVFRFDFLHYLFAEGTDFRGTRDGHVVVAFVSAMGN